MPDFNNWNQGIITEFRANEGRVGGPFAGAPMILVHHVGRTSGKEYISPLVYLSSEDDDSMYIFASKGGAPDNPDWYRNLIAAGEATVEVATSTFQVAITELTGDERDRVFAEQVKRMPASATTPRRPRASARSPCCNSPAASRARGGTVRAQPSLNGCQARLRTRRR
jgi:deazaflavin-dependent oxidoreductase (nitroreductase family)